MQDNRPGVGIGIIVEKDGKILLGHRLSSHGAGAAMLPGGHLEFGESFESCAKRELAEEAGLTDVEIQGVVSIGNDIAYDKHYVSIVLLAKWKSGEPYDAEPEKSCNWHWADPHELPDEVFYYSKKAIANWLKGSVYSDA